METNEARRLIALAERGAVALERIAAALEATNAADPLQMIQEALAMEKNRPGTLDGDQSAINPGPHADDEVIPPHIARLLGKQAGS